MITPIQCQNCEGFGCKDCNYIGWFMRNDEEGVVYYTQRIDGKLSLGSKKMPESGWKKLNRKLFGEPHDLLWSIKTIQEANRRK